MVASTNIKEMKNPSIVLYKAGDARLEDRPVPEIEDPHDVLIRIAYVGVCGSDVHFYRHGGISRMVNPSIGITMGHEASGVIAAIGSVVTTLSVGDHVAIEPGQPCRYCRPCKSGSYHLCKKMRFAADPGPPVTPGALSKYYRLSYDFVYRVPPTLSLQEAVLVEPTAVAVHASLLAAIRPGETVVVLGSGTIGLLVGSVARSFGAHRVVLVDVLAPKLSFASSFLPCETFLSSTSSTAEDNASALLSQLGVDEVDSVIECSGAPSSIEMGIYLLRAGGKYVQTGMGRSKIEFPMTVMSEKELLVRGCFRYNSGDYELAVSLISKGMIDVKPLISSETDFEDATAAWEKTARGEGIKNLIRGVQD
ncbi:GroES-like protein [Bimuria novae-zelandiae CBS 107.79]|uniref:D-xylulose reductase n=1 Tax=Bimuria novae-zelandiae CBS 107.79 TaxID=1447943 RepID=A0A6A5VEG0_9PLEO|nr:GroES-like protein [Bimuria novae-zelandiae CBS 107.79]